MLAHTLWTACEVLGDVCALETGSQLISSACHAMCHVMSCHIISFGIMSWTEQMLLLPQTPTSNGDENVLYSYLVNHTTSGGGNNQLTALGTTWAAVPCWWAAAASLVWWPDILVDGAFQYFWWLNFVDLRQVSRASFFDVHICLDTVVWALGSNEVVAAYRTTTGSDVRFLTCMWSIKTSQSRSRIPAVLWQGLSACVW